MIKFFLMAAISKCRVFDCWHAGRLVEQAREPTMQPAGLVTLTMREPDRLKALADFRWILAQR
jgi:hypothetical protein